MKNKKIILFIIIFIISIILILGVIFSGSKISKEEQSVTILNGSNCEVSVNESEKSVEITNFEGNDECVVIPNKIGDYEVDKVDSNVFSNCYNLDTIKISKNVSDNIGEIPDFEINEEESTDEYVVYNTTRQYSELYSKYEALPEEEKNKISIIPNKYEVPLSTIYSDEMEDKYKVSELKSDEIPSKYDLRDYISIGVERQRDFGICYAFASLTSVETNLALTQNINVDFSEIHSAILTTGYSGQLFQASTNYYANLLGPVYEKDYAMRDIYGNSKNEIFTIINKYLSGSNIKSTELTKIQDYAKMTSAEKKVTRTTTFPTVTATMKEDEKLVITTGTIRNTIKKHIMEYGSVAVYIDSSSMISSYNGHAVACSNGSNAVDHTVSIIGWDDDYSKDNFPDVPGMITKPSGNGAYLALNSWGDTWGEGGYLWISYEDAYVEQSPVGVVLVEDIESNISVTKTKVEDTDLDKEISSIDIPKGKKLRVTVDVEVNEVIDGNSLSVKVQRNKEYITNLFNIQIGEILNNKATIVLTVDSQYLNDGENRIEIYYGADKAYTSIEIIDDFEYIVNEDETISITKYIGLQSDVVVPIEYRGYRVYEICDNAFEDSTIEKLEIQNGIKSIGDYALANCIRLEEVSIPESITNIGKYAFSNCSKIDAIVIPSDVENLGDGTFQKCSSLADLTLNDGLKTIGYETFYFCSSIQNIDLPNSVTSIGERSFHNCTKLQTINLSESLTNIGDSSFGFCVYLNNVVIPDSITELGTGVFAQCSGLTNITFSRNMKEIANSTFFSCSHLQTITIPEGIEKINEYAFYKCERLESVSFPSTLSFIGNSAFSACKVLDNVVIPDSVTSMETSPFTMCTGLTDITISSGLKELPGSMFYGCTGLKNITVPEGVEKIGNCAFGRCTNLETLSLPNSLTFIGRLIVTNCDKLDDITIPKGVTTIDFKAFMDCKGIKEIVIPKSVKSIGESAFENCTSLKSITIYRETKTFGKNIFKNVSSDFVLNCEASSEAYNYAVSNEYNYNIIIDEVVFEEFEKIAGGDGNNYLEGIEQGTTIEELLQDESNVEVYKDDVKITENVKLSTGMELRVNINDEITTYQVVIPGDITGDGEIDDSDLLIFSRYVIGCSAEQDKVKEAYLMATDFNKDNNLASDSDILKLARSLIGL